MIDNERGRFEFNFNKTQIALLFTGIAIMAIVMFALGMVVGKSVTDIKSSISEPAKATPAPPVQPTSPPTAAPSAPAAPAPLAPPLQATADQAQVGAADQPPPPAAKQETTAPPVNSSTGAAPTPQQQIPIVKPVPEATIVPPPAATTQDATAASKEQKTDGSVESKRKPRRVPRKILPSKEEPAAAAEVQVPESQAAAEPVTPAKPSGKKTAAKTRPRAKTVSASPATGKGYVVQVGSFSTEQQANLLVSRLGKHGYYFYVHPAEVEDKGTWYQVRSKKLKNRDDAERMFSKLQKNEGLQPLIITAK